MDTSTPPAAPRHTPGPWAVRPASGHILAQGHGFEITSAHVECPQWFIAATWSELPEGQEQANATLIAAAPDMLAALEGIAAQPEVSGILRSLGPRNNTMGSLGPWIALARAIAKAKGERQ